MNLRQGQGVWRGTRLRPETRTLRITTAMLGFAWLALRKAEKTLRSGRLEEAQRMLRETSARLHKRCGQVLQELAQAYAKRGRGHLERQDTDAAWRDLLAAEQVEITELEEVGTLRRQLTERVLAQANSLLEGNEPAQVLELAARLGDRFASVPELRPYEEAAKEWLRARELAGRGELGQARQAIDRARGLIQRPVAPVDKLAGELKKNQEALAGLLPLLHEAVQREQWPEVVRLAEQVLAIAPQHAEARQARSRAWRATEPATVTLERPAETQTSIRTVEEAGERFLLWIDGVGGFLVCLGARLTIGQATPETYVDVPVFADVSRVHAIVSRDAEGYLLEAVRPVRVNDATVEKALLRSEDRITMGGSFQMQFRQPVPLSASARLDLVSGHRLALAVDAVLLMADTLVLGPGSQVHVAMPDVKQSVVLYRHKEGLGVRYAGSMWVDNRAQRDRASLHPSSAVRGDDFALAIEPVGQRMGRM